MKKERILGNIIFWLTLILPMLAFVLASIIGEANIFGVAGIIRYSWVMLLFIPIGILSIIIGIKLRHGNQKYKKNLIIAFICLPLIIIFGSCRFIFANFSYDSNKIITIADETKLVLPEQIKIATIKFDAYNISYAKVINKEGKEKFETELNKNKLWQDKLGSEIEILLPENIFYEVLSFDYFISYNKTTDNYNAYIQEERDEYIFIAYDCETQRLIILET